MVVSHERDRLTGIVDRILEIENGALRPAGTSLHTVREVLR